MSNTKPKKVVNSIEEQKPQLVVIVQKVRDYTLRKGFVRLKSDNTIVDYVRTHLDKIGETKYFDIYK